MCSNEEVIKLVNEIVEMFGDERLTLRDILCVFDLVLIEIERIFELSEDEMKLIKEVSNNGKMAVS